MVCFGKAPVERCFKSKSRLQAFLSSYFNISLGEGAFVWENPQMPIGICNNCRIKVPKASPGDVKLAHQSFEFIGDVSPSGTSCKCVICQTAKNQLSNLSNHGYGKIRKNLFTTSTRCDKCWSIVKPNQQHHCTPATLASNISNKVNEPSNSKVGEQVTSQFLKEAPKSPSGTVRLSQPSGGRPLPVTLGAASPASPKQKVSTSDLLEFQIANNLGDAQTKNVATFLNKKIGKGTVEVDFQQKLAKANKFFDSDFVSTPTSFQTNGPNPSLYEADLVHVPSLSDFLLKVLKEGGSNPHEYDVKLGIDKGQNILKVTVSLVPRVTDDSEGCSVNYFAKQSVNDLFIVAACSGVEENHFNLKTILEKIRASEAQFFFMADLKVINMLCGIQSHACMHPCYACTQHKDNLGQDSCLRTVDMILQNHQAYLDSSRTAEALQAQNNVKNYPLITFSSSQGSLPLLFLIPPPELHLMLGPFKDFFKALLAIFPEAIQWPQSIFKNQKAYHGGEFVGNDIRDLLANVDFLQNLVEQYSKFEAMPLVRVFRAFRDVIKSCFGAELQPDYLDRIAEFKSALFDASVKITPKMHIIIFHVPQWCGHFKKALGVVSEQALEASHKKFKKYFDRYKVGVTNPRFGEQLRTAVCSFNSKALFHQLIQLAKESGEKDCLQQYFDLDE